MDHRYDHLHKVNGQSLHEQFYYDRRNQLTDTYLNGTLASHIIYDNLGNITSKTATGGFEYQSGNSPYQLTSIVPDQNIDPGYKLSQNITYTDFNKVESITGNGYKLEIEYGLENQRISQSLSSVNQSGQTTLLLNKHFIGGLQEKIFYETGAETTISYISSPEGLTAIEVKSGIIGEWYTVLTDHLGSITTLIRESDGNRFELSYDAWGNRRNPATWTNYSGNLPDFIAITDADFITDRGFTGHEQLDMFGLINMNGRVYDPVASRFLSPDSFVQSPQLALNYNGYVYCLNNPLKYTDPDGEWVHLVIGAAIGGISNWIANGAEFTWEGLGYFGIGAAAGALGAGVGLGVNVAIAGGSFSAGFLGTATVASTGFIAGAATGASAGITNGLIQGTGNGLLGGQSLGEAFVQGGLDQAWKQGLTGGATGGILGGIHAANNNRNFWTGAQKTYKILDAPLLASTDNGITINQDGFTIQNNSGETIYYKPETTDPLRGIKGDGAYAIRDGRGIKHAVDGVTAPGKHAQVFKITDPFSASSIRVSYSSISIDKPYVFGELSINKALGGGWLTSPPDQGWYQIFKMAGYVFR